MFLHTDIPTREQFDRLLTSRNPASVSIYVPTDPASASVGERIELSNLATDVVAQLRDAGVARRDLAAIEEELEDLVDYDEFWRFQTRSLATFVTPESLTSFRLPNRLPGAVEVSDRFHVKPLFRAVTFPQVALVLALAQGSVRLLEVSPDAEPGEVRLPDLPSDAASAARRASIADRAPVRRIQGAEGRKVRLRQYALKVDQALRPFVGGLDTPLILAAAEPLASIFRSVNSYPRLALAGIEGNPERTPDAELAAKARTVLDEIYARELRDTHERFERRRDEGRALIDVGEVARAATRGAVDTLLVDIDEVVPGSVDERSGEVTFADGADGYGVVDEIARRTWLNSGRVLAVRREDVPDRSSVAAILRYAI